MTDPVAKRRPLAGLKLTADDDPRQRKTYPLLRQSLAASGINNVPIFHTPDGSVVDGNTRVCGLLDLGLTECLSIELPADWTEAQILKFSIATDGVRRTLPPEELAKKAERYIEVTNCTQEAAARELGISPGHLSRALSCLLLPAKHAERAQKLSASVRSTIAPLREAKLQDAAMDFATTPDAKGNLPTRDAVVLWLKRQRGGKHGRKPKAIKLKAANGIDLTVPAGQAAPTLVSTDGGILMVLPADIDYEQAEADLKDALARIRKGKKIGEAEVQPVLLPAS